MKFDNERTKEYCEFEMTFTNEEARRLREYGLAQIMNDDNELINYAVNHILKEMINGSKKTGKILKLIKKEQKTQKCK